MAKDAKITQRGKSTAKKGRSAGSPADLRGQTVRDVMTTDPISLLGTETIERAAQCMRDSDVGAIIVLDDTSARVCGIVTDRDLVIRALADGREPATTTLGSVCSAELVLLSPADTAADAVQLMRDKAIRRIPVVENDKAVGIVSIGDLAVEHDPKSALADISRAPGNV